jgi:hypothetical protein
MGKFRSLTLAVLFGAFSGTLAIVVQLGATAIMGVTLTGETLLSAVFGGIGVFAVGVLTVLFVWPRIGFDPFDSHTHKPT